MDMHAVTEVITPIVASLAVTVSVGSYMYQKKRDRDVAAESERLKRFDKFQQMQSRYTAEQSFGQSETVDLR